MADDPGLLQLLRGGKPASGHRILERLRELRQLAGLRSVSAVVGRGGSFLELAGKLRNQSLELLRTLRLQLLELIEKPSGGRKAEHISLLLDGGS